MEVGYGPNECHTGGHESSNKFEIVRCLASGAVDMTRGAMVTLVTLVRDSLVGEPGGCQGLADDARHEYPSGAIQCPPRSRVSLEGEGGERERTEGRLEKESRRGCGAYRDCCCRCE
jgi:hypothetical protein